MTGMTFEQQKQLYLMIETAVKEKTPIVFPEGVYPVLQTGRSSGGPTFTIPGLLWVDERRNVYEAWMMMEYRNKDALSPGLYVCGSKTPDGFSSGDLSMFITENRYTTKL